MRKIVFYVLLVASIIVTAVAPAAAQETTETPTPDTATAEWRVRRVSDGSYGPELGLSRPGLGTTEFEVATMGGYELRFQTADGEVILTGGCQQAIIAPNVYARNSGGEDWGFVVWEINPNVTNTTNEMAVLSFELAAQQVQWEDCDDVEETGLLDHIYVVTQDEENSRLVMLTPWREYRRSTGEDSVLMIAPGDTFYGWNVGLGDSQDNLCDGGGCYLESAPTWGWVGGGIINSTWEGEIPSDATPIAQDTIDSVLESLETDD